MTTDLAMATLWKGSETHIEQSLYKRIPSTDLSKQILSAETKRLLVLRLGEVGWSDLGGPERVLAMFPPGSEPVWMAEWRRANGARPWRKTLRVLQRASQATRMDFFSPRGTRGFGSPGA